MDPFLNIGSGCVFFQNILCPMWSGVPWQDHWGWQSEGCLSYWLCRTRCLLILRRCQLGEELHGGDGDWKVEFLATPRLLGIFWTWIIYMQKMLIWWLLTLQKNWFSIETPYTLTFWREAEKPHVVFFLDTGGYINVTESTCKTFLLLRSWLHHFWWCECVPRQAGWSRTDSSYPFESFS